MTRLVVVSAGLSVPSTTRILADQLAEAAVAALGQRSGAGSDSSGSGGPEVSVEVVELRPLAHALADAMLTGFPTGELAEAVELVTGADALVVVTPVFSASYSGLFKMFFDVLEPEALAGKPVLMGATAGTPRHSLILEHALRPLFSYLKAVPVPTAVFAASQDLGAEVDSRLRERIERAGSELAALLGTGRVHAARRGRTLEEEFEDPTPFEDLLSSF